MRITHADAIRRFKHVGRISHTNDGTGLAFNVQSSESTPCVYLWVSCFKEEKTIIYVGKAGRSLDARCAQHAAGFKSSKTGQQHFTHLSQLLNFGNTVLVYALWPEPVSYWDRLIPSHASVEEWLIKALDPTPIRNKIGKNM